MTILLWLSIGIILYVYAGYPLLVTLLARLRTRERPYPAITPSLTLLIAAYNEEDVIAAKLENSLKLDYPDHLRHILVTADGSSDATPDIVRQFADRGVELTYMPQRQGKMAAINRAMPRARGDIVVFSDANNLYDTQALRELVKPFADTAVAAVSGSKTIIKDGSSLGHSEGLYWRYESFIKKQETHLGSCTGVAGEILALRHELFEPPPDNIINDDFYMAMRLIKRGYRVVYAPQARSYEYVSASAEDEIVRRSRIVAGRYQAMGLLGQLLPWNRPLTAWQMVSHKFLRPFVPLAMIAAFLTNLIIVAQGNTEVYGVLLGLQVLFYLLAVLGQWRPGDGLIGKLLYLPAFLISSNWAALVGLIRFLTKRQTTLWQRAQRRQQNMASVQTDVEEKQQP
jgi:cellulose synthase/poly-beta-1,6-N-acetylglucosamine synthase-like glycosyltransferase